MKRLLESYAISKEFHFSASHVLLGLPDSHPCSRLHGHNYVIKIFLRAKAVDSVGFVRDYRELEPIKKYIDENLDHQHLNQVIPNLNPTAENIAKFLYDSFSEMFPEIYAVEVSETPRSNARYEAGEY